jgi:hypothetical protein
MAMSTQIRSLRITTDEERRRMWQRLLAIAVVLLFVASLVVLAIRLSPPSAGLSAEQFAAAVKTNAALLAMSIAVGSIAFVLACVSFLALWRIQRQCSADKFK